MKTICALVDINIIIDALNNNNFDDFEDCLQMESAQTVNADYIVTRNIDDFSASSVPAISAEEFIKLFDDVKK